MGKICANCGTNNPENYKYCSSCGHELPRSETAATVQMAHAPILPAPKKNKTGKVLLFILAAILYYILVGFAIKRVFNSSLFFDKVMVKLADGINKNCPQMISDGIRLDNVNALSGNVFQYNYTLTNIGDTPMDTTQVKAEAAPRMIESLRSNPEMKIFRDHKTTLDYCYHRSNGDYLFTVRITADQYE